MIAVSSITIYPIKACGGISLSQANIVPGGLEHDRRFMLVDSRGKFITRRQETRLARVGLTSMDGGFHVFAEHSGNFDLRAKPAQGELRQSTPVEVWSDTVEGLVHPEGSDWFSALLGREVRLVYMPEEALRQVNPERSRPGDRVSFADGYPLLLTSESSLSDLNARLDEPVPMSRFRPNVVVCGSSAFEEDLWRDVELGETPCTIPKLCDRCVVTTIEEGTARKEKEPLKTLARFRRWDGAVWFGANVIPRGPGKLRVGDSVSIKSTRPHPAG